MSSPPSLYFRRPIDSHTRHLLIKARSKSTITARAHVDIILSTWYKLIISDSNLSCARPLSLAKRLHWFSHGPTTELTCLLRRACYRNDSLENAVELFGKKFLPCAKSGHTLPSKKISLWHLYSALNDLLRADFVFYSIRNWKVCVLHAIDAATSYIETQIVCFRSATVMDSRVKTIWLMYNQDPKEFVSDLEFQTSPMKAFLTASGSGINLQQQRVTRHNKTGIRQWFWKRILTSIYGRRAYCSTKPFT